MSDQQQLREWFEREQQRPRNSVVQALDSLGLQNGDRVADIGCGPGVHLRHIFERVAPDGQVLGLDTDLERLAVAESLLEEQIVRGSIRVAEGDLHALDPELGSFDLVWMSLVLHHEEIPVDVVRGLRDIAAPGGRIAILDGDDLASLPFIPWSPEFELTIRRAVVRAAQENGGGPRQFGRRYTARSLPAILADAGLHDIQFRAFTDIRVGPLDGWELDEQAAWFIDGFGGRMRDYLAPADWRQYEACFTPGAPECLLTRPDFFMVRTWFLGVGMVE